MRHVARSARYARREAQQHTLQRAAMAAITVVGKLNCAGFHKAKALVESVGSALTPTIIPMQPIDYDLHLIELRRELGGASWAHTAGVAVYGSEFVGDEVADRGGLGLEPRPITRGSDPRDRELSVKAERRSFGNMPGLHVLHQLPKEVGLRRPERTRGGEVGHGV